MPDIEQQPAQLLADYLQLPDHQLPRLQRLLNDRPMRWSELADLGHSSPMGRRLQHCWSDIQAPQQFLSVRSFVGGRLLLDGWAMVAKRDATAVLDDLLKRQPPIRHIRQQLAQDLLQAEPPQPWPTLTGDLQQLTMLPLGLITLPNPAGEPEAVAALGIQVVAGEHGPVLSWAAWGIDGSSWSDGWSAKPDHSSACSRLAWGIVAVQHREPEELLASGQTGTGVIRSPRERPAPSWVEPPRRYVAGPAGEPVSTGGHVRAHWRQAHPHRYWTGRGRKTMTTRWIPAIWCADGPEQAA